MGKKRIKIVSAKEEPKKKTGLPGETSRRLVKTGKEHGRITDVGAEVLAEAERIKEKEEKLAKEILSKAVKKGEKAAYPTKKRGSRWAEAHQKIDRHHLYPLPEAIKLLKSTSITKFNGSVDVHLNVTKVGLKGAVKFPHPTGKEQKIRIADEEIVKELEQGKINFTTLITTPQMMPKLTKFAKLLGPRGLMPNPKAGTISDKPEELVKKLSGRTQFKTEAKFPLIHLTIGRVEDKPAELEANFKALIEAVGEKNIRKAVVCPTMGPGIKVDLEKT
jgi:large subunit ribosomal protein L1